MHMILHEKGVRGGPGGGNGLGGTGGKGGAGGLGGVFTNPSHSTTILFELLRNSARNVRVPYGVVTTSKAYGSYNGVALTRQSDGGKVAAW